MITVRCPNPSCKNQTSINDRFIGRQVKCSKCGTQFVIAPPTPTTALSPLETTPLSQMPTPPEPQPSPLPQTPDAPRNWTDFTTPRSSGPVPLADPVGDETLVYSPRPAAPRENEPFSFAPAPAPVPFVTPETSAEQEAPAESTQPKPVFFEPADAPLEPAFVSPAAPEAVTFPPVEEAFTPLVSPPEPDFSVPEFVPPVSETAYAEPESASFESVPAVAGGEIASGSVKASAPATIEQESVSMPGSVTRQWTPPQTTTPPDTPTPSAPEPPMGVDSGDFHREIPSAPTAPKGPAGPLTPDTLLAGRFRIQSIVGRGGMGTVYKARHERLKTFFAVKEIFRPHRDEAEYQAQLAQCEREMEFLTSLDHPNLPKVNDAFVENERYYLIMEFIEGVTLEARLTANAGPLPPDLVVDWALQITDVLSYLHSMDPPVIFRDMKPANVMVQPDGRIRLIDFGIARRFQPAASKDTALLGSVGYSPPEQFGKHQTDRRADIYAFGATLHQLLTGRDPAKSPFKFQPAHILNPAVPEELSNLLQHCLALDADSRPSTVDDVAVALIAVRDILGPPSAQTMATPPHAAETLRTGRGGSGSGGRTMTGNSGTARPTTGSNEILRPPSQNFPTQTAASTSAAPPNRSKTNILIAILTLVVLALLIAVLYSLRPRGNTAPQTPKTKVTGANKPPILMPPDGNATPPKTETPPPEDREAAAPVLQNSPVEFAHTEVRGLVANPDGSYSVQAAAVGRVRGHNSDHGSVGIQYYDTTGQPLPASGGEEAAGFANSRGDLGIFISLQVESDDQPFDVALNIPLKHFPVSTANARLQYRCKVFLKDRLVGETALLPVPFTLPANFDAPNPADGTTENPVPSRPTSRGRIEGGFGTK